MNGKTIMIKAIAIAVICFTVSLYAEYKPKTVELTALDRLAVGMLLPKETSFVNWKILNDLKMNLSLTEEEVKKINIQQAENGMVLANWYAVPMKKIEFGEVAEGWIISKLVELDKNEKLLPEHIRLYKKFVLNEQEEKEVVK